MTALYRFGFTTDSETTIKMSHSSNRSGRRTDLVVGGRDTDVPCGRNPLHSSYC